MDKYILVHGIKIASDFVPETFGRLTTIGPRFRMGRGKGKKVTFQVCQCSCPSASVIVVRCGNLGNGTSQSCGCLQKEIASQANTIHGLSKQSIFTTYQGMLDRCTNPNNKSYVDYGGRGIKVCARWREPKGQGFINFMSDVGQKPSPAHTIERKEVDGDYCPENCIWDTRENQGRNKRNNVWLELDGERMIATDWALRLGVDKNILLRRVRKGWSDEKVLLTPIKLVGPRKRKAQ